MGSALRVPRRFGYVQIVQTPSGFSERLAARQTQIPQTVSAGFARADGMEKLVLKIVSASL